MADTMQYSELAACTLHLKRVDPERLSNDDQVTKQQERLRHLCSLMDLTPIDINVKRSMKRKGQAFITFSSPSDAATAQSLLNGFQMVKGGRNIEAEIARVPWDGLVEKFCSKEELEEHVRRRKSDKDRKKALEAAQQSAAPTTTAPKRPGDTSTSTRPAKAPKTNKNVIPDEYLPPNNTLFIREVPSEYESNLEMLEALFSRYPGFKEVRTIPLPQFKGCAFVEYEANEGAIQAREALNGKILGDAEVGLKVTYQKAG